MPSHHLSSTCYATLTLRRMCRNPLHPRGTVVVTGTQTSSCHSVARLGQAGITPVPCAGASGQTRSNAAAAAAPTASQQQPAACGAWQRQCSVSMWGRQRDWACVRTAVSVPAAPRCCLSARTSHLRRCSAAGAAADAAPRHRPHRPYRGVNSQKRSQRPQQCTDPVAGLHMGPRFAARLRSR